MNFNISTLNALQITKLQNTKNSLKTTKNVLKF